MDIPVPDKEQEKKEYIDDLHTLQRAKIHIEKTIGEEEAIDYMISEIKNYVTDGKFSKHCYEYAEKENPQLTEEQLAEILPKTWDGKPIFSYRDLK